MEELTECPKCHEERNDIAERYSYGIYAGKFCEDCCSTYRDNCGLNGEQGDPYTDLDEQIDDDY